MLLGFQPHSSGLVPNCLKCTCWGLGFFCDCVDVTCITVAQKADVLSTFVELYHGSASSTYSKLLRARLLGSSRLAARGVHGVSEELTSLVKVVRMAIEIAEVRHPRPICMLLSTTTCSAGLRQTRLLFSCRQHTSLLVSLCGCPSSCPCQQRRLLSHKRLVKLRKHAAYVLLQPL